MGSVKRNDDVHLKVNIRPVVSSSFCPELNESLQWKGQLFQSCDMFWIGAGTLHCWKLYCYKKVIHFVSMVVVLHIADMFNHVYISGHPCQTDFMKGT